MDLVTFSMLRTDFKRVSADTIERQTGGNEALCGWTHPILAEWLEAQAKY